MERFTIAITGTGSLIGQAIIKSIQRSSLRERIRIIGFDYFNNTVGSFWCEKNVLLPDILKKEVSREEWQAIIVETLIANNVKVLFVGVDFEMPLLAERKSLIEEKTGVVIVVSSPEAIAIADDKYLTYDFLKRSHLSFPETFLPAELPSSLEYPLIVKPRKGARSVGVHKVKDENELMKALESVKDPLIQECIGDESTEFTCGLIYMDNELKQSIVLNRSLKDGNTYISRYKKDFPEIIGTYISAIASCLKPFGPCNLQLRLDKNLQPKLFEINCRHSGTTYIRSLFGFREVEYILNKILFNEEIDFQLKEGTVVRYFDEFFVPGNR
jgi:carbamoyl-phosphate synthase large subunit